MTAWQAENVYTSGREALFLMPNGPGGPGEPEYVARPSGILLPKPLNPLDTLERYMPAAGEIFRKIASPIKVNDPAEFKNQVQDYRRRGAPF